MPGWNGAGIFELRYTFVNDALAGVKILASRQDAMWTDVKTGLQNCWTLDGQTTPTANMDMGGFRLTNVAAGVDDDDLARMDQVISDQWVRETAGVAWVSATQFKVLATDVTALHRVGRRLKIVHNGGATTMYARITSASFSTDTTITIGEVDDSTSLVSTVVAVYYGIVTPGSSTSHPFGTCVSVYSSADQTGLASGGTSTRVAFSTENYDRFGEYEPATRKFTALYRGTYFIQANVLVSVSAAQTVTVSIIVSGVNFILSKQYVATTSVPFAIPVSLCTLLGESSYVEIGVDFSAGSSNNILTYSQLNVARVF